jgi:site-specific DNA-methyltransferase (adenine-specific)
MSASKIYNADCMDPEIGLPSYPDNYFDLAIVDPPYGIGADAKNSKGEKQSHKSASASKYYGDQKWDADIPSDNYFDELSRVSKRQIIWGANYFGLSGGMLFWNKNVTMPTYSRGEIAYLSWMKKVDYVECSWHGMIQHDMSNRELRIHPTQKPVALYRWLLENYANPGDLILDTNVGSASSLIACESMGFEYVGYELDTDYYNAAKNRMAKGIQMQLL